MRRMSRYLMLVAAVLLCMFAFSVNAEAETVATEGYYTYEVYGHGDSCHAMITHVDRSISGAVVVPETLGGYPVNNIGSYAFTDCTNMTSIVLPDAVDIINCNAFENCSSLKSIVMNEMYWIGEDIFSGCTALTDVWCAGYKACIDIEVSNDELEAATWHEGICTKHPNLGSHTFENGDCTFCQKWEFPFTDISLMQNDIYIIENTHGFFYEDVGYYVYDSIGPEFIAVLKDGSYVSAKGKLEINDIRFGVSYNLGPQYDAAWTVGNTYAVSYALDCWEDEHNFAPFAPVTANLNVHIVENPVQKIEIQDVTLKQYTNGYYQAGIYYYNIPELTAVVTFKDGTTESFSQSLEVYGEMYDLENNAWELQHTQPWGAGTYEVTGTLLGVTDTFTITVESPIASIEIQDISITQYTDGYFEEGNYYYDLSDISAIVTLKDGTVETISSGIAIDDRWYYLQHNAQELQEEQPWGVGTYSVTATLMGISDTFTVTIEEPPIASIQIQDVELTEGRKGYYDDGYFYYSIPVLTAVVTYKDGTVETVEGYIEIGDDWYSIRDNASELQEEQPWGVGTYEVTGTLMGVSDTFTVTIKESPIASIQIQDVKIIEHTNGYYDEGVYYYEMPYLTAVVTFKDGTTQTVYEGGYIEINGEWCWIRSNFRELQEEQPWGLGTYEVTGTLLGVSDTFTVTIVESPIASIEILDKQIIEHTHGSYDQAYFYYDLPALTAVVTFKDGTVDTIQGGIEIDEQWYNIQDNAWELQEEQPWGLGTYEVTGTFMGVSDTFKVTIVETPVAGITCSDIIMIEGIDGYSSYDPTGYLKEVLLKDGTKAQIDGDYIVYNGEYYFVSNNAAEWQDYETWQSGNSYEVTATVMGVSTTFKVTVVENPVQKLEVVKMPTKTEYLVGEWLNMQGATIRICYKDGTYEDIFVKDDFAYGEYYGTVYSKKMDRISYLSPSEGIWFYSTEQKTAEIELFNEFCDIPVVVKENKAQSITIREDASKSLIITVHNSDNTSYDMKVLDLLYVEYWYDEYQAYFVTDKGMFVGYIMVTEDSFTITLHMDSEGFKSNTLQRSEWFEMLCYLQQHGIRHTALIDGFLSSYNGEITAENIDSLVFLALLTESMRSDNGISDMAISFTDTMALIKADALRECMLKYFAIDAVDLSLSAYYDAQNNTYTLLAENASINQDIYDCAQSFRVKQMTYSDGVWTIKMFAVYGKNERSTIDLKLTDDYKILSFALNAPADETTGDFDGDNTITQDDAVYLLLNTMFGEELYPLNGAYSDINNDGSTDQDDAVYLLLYTMFGEDLYPINTVALPAETKE